MDDRAFGRLVIGLCLVLMPSERVWSSIAGIGSLYSDLTPVYPSSAGLSRLPALRESPRLPILLGGRVGGRLATRPERCVDNP